LLFPTIEAFTNSERKRAAGDCEEAFCPLYRNEYMGSVTFQAKVGIPFIPKLEVLFDKTST
jgi:hypothetical protein